MNSFEKKPLNPSSLENGPCTQEYCQKRQEKYKVLSAKTSGIIMVFGAILFLFCHLIGNSTLYSNRKSSDEQKKAHYGCHKPTIPYNGVSRFSFKPGEYQKLNIEHRRPKIGHYLHIISGATSVYVDERLSDITVDIDVKFNNDGLQDIFSIESSIEGDVYNIYFDNKDIEYKDNCAEINIAIGVPSASALENLFMKLTNNAYILEKDLDFKELHLVTANGSFDFKKGISVGRLTLIGSNSSIKGTISYLSGDATIRTSNGFAEVLVQKIIKENDIDISITSSNGHIRLELPDDFESNFKLISSLGKLLVESSDPSLLHQTRRLGQLTSGYYGHDENPNNTVSLITSNGRINLKYQ